MWIQPAHAPSSVYDYSDPSIRQAWIAALCYLAASLAGAILTFGQRQAALPAVIVGLIIQAVIVLPLAFGIYKESRVAVVLMLVYVVATQLYVWIVLRSFSGTIVSVFVTGFLLRGPIRIFEHHAEQREAAAAATTQTKP